MTGFFKTLRLWFQEGWNETLYWKFRKDLQDGKRLWGGAKLLIVRRVERRKCSNTGLGLPGNCCYIKSPLILPHSLNGIIIARNVEIGENVAIYQHVTIAESDKLRKTIIEDNVIIGAGAVILNNPTIGKGAKIGANAVVVGDVPKGATAVGVPAKIIMKNEH